MGHLLINEKQKFLDINQLTDPKFVFASEITKIEKSLTSTEILISDFEGASLDSCFKRDSSRLIYVIARIQRRPLTDANDAEIETFLRFKNEAHATVLRLEAQLYNRVKDTDPNSFLNNSVLDTNVLNISLQPLLVTPNSSKSFPLYKIGIQSAGNPRNLLSLIEKLEEVSFVRNVAKFELFK